MSEQTAAVEDTNSGAGFYVMGRYTSLAWFLRREDAEAEVHRLVLKGAWSSILPYVEPCKRRETV